MYIYYYIQIHICTHTHTRMKPKKHKNASDDLLAPKYQVLTSLDTNPVAAQRQITVKMDWGTRS